MASIQELHPCHRIITKSSRKPETGERSACELVQAFHLCWKINIIFFNKPSRINKLYRHHTLFHILISSLVFSLPILGLLNSTASRNCVIESLQTCCLLLPPASRRKLHLLLRLMHKMVNNSRLQVEDGVSTRKLVGRNNPLRK